MKKIFYLFILSILGNHAFGQVTFNPAVFSAEDEVTVTVDVAGTPMAGQADAYIWTFSNPDGSPAKDGSSNGSWTNSNASGKMTSAGTNKFTYTFTGTELFSLTPGELKSFGFLVKTRDGSKQTQDFKPFNFDPLVFTPSKLRVFPAQVGANEVVTVNFDKTLGTSVNEQRMTVTSATITMFDEASTQVGNPLTIPARLLQPGIWSASFVGSMSFTPAGGHKLTRFTYKFNGTVRDENGVSTQVSSSEGDAQYVSLK